MIVYEASQDADDTDVLFALYERVGAISDADQLVRLVRFCEPKDGQPSVSVVSCEPDVKRLGASHEDWLEQLS